MGLAAGPSAFGRLALTVGWPSLAANLLPEPAWRGVALYRAGRLQEADDAFAALGQRATFNRATSLARLGHFALSIAYYDAVLFREPSDEEARANRALVASLVDPVLAEGLDAPGLSIRELQAKDQSTDPPTPRSDASTTPTQEATLPLNPRFMAQSIVASRQWLAALEDEPGRYLKLRLAAEQRRRIEQGTAVPPGGDPW
jgi:Ca-activated chloride channel family protein